MAKNKMLKLDITFSLSSSVLLFSFVSFSFLFAFELGDSRWQLELREGSECNGSEDTEA